MSLQKDLARHLGVTPRIRWGGFGQLDVLVDGKLVFSKKEAGRSPTVGELVKAAGAARPPSAPGTRSS